MTKNKIPVGFAMASEINLDAMQKFASMSEEQIIIGTHCVKCREKQ